MWYVFMSLSDRTHLLFQQAIDPGFTWFSSVLREKIRFDFIHFTGL